MTEYIEREAAIKEAIAERDLHSSLTPELSGWRVGAEKVANRLASIPAADVRPVVQCRECKYWSESPVIKTIGNCIIMPMRATHEFFCAYGEKKGNNDE